MSHASQVRERKFTWAGNLFGIAHFGFALAVTSVAGAAASAEDFYRGKVIRIVVGFSAGGGFDTFARTLARYMGKYVPGNPSIIVENMPGAGSLIAANHVYRVAKPDGLTIGAFNGNQILANWSAPRAPIRRAEDGLGRRAGLQPRSLRSAPTHRYHERRAMAGGEDAAQARRQRARRDDDDIAKVLKEAIGLPMRL